MKIFDFHGRCSGRDSGCFFFERFSSRKVDKRQCRLGQTNKGQGQDHTDESCHVDGDSANELGRNDTARVYMQKVGLIFRPGSEL